MEPTAVESSSVPITNVANVECFGNATPYGVCKQQMYHVLAEGHCLAEPCLFVHTCVESTCLRLHDDAPSEPQRLAAMLVSTERCGHALWPCSLYYTLY